MTEGDLGSLPVIIGLAVIWLIFWRLNPNFLTSRNLTNLVLQIAAVGTISAGVVLVLLLGEIDLSVGAVSGLCAAVMAFFAPPIVFPSVNYTQNPIYSASSPTTIGITQTQQIGDLSGRVLEEIAEDDHGAVLRFERREAGGHALRERVSEVAGVELFLSLGFPARKSPAQSDSFRVDGTQGALRAAARAPLVRRRSSA